MRSLPVCLLVVASFIAFPAASPAQDQDWKKQLEESLKGHYTLTKLQGGLLATPGTVKEAGITLTVLKPGLMSQFDPKAIIQRRSRVRNGQVVNQQAAADAGFYILAVGDQVYVNKIDVNDNNVTLNVVTVEAIGQSVRGNSITARYFGTIEFQFDKAWLSTASAEDVIKGIGSVLGTSAQATAATTIELGQSMADVERILGKPENVVKLGAKVMYTYKNLKVVFVDGKVMDVQ